MKNGFNGTVVEWLESLKGSQGKSAYQLCVESGQFSGTEIEWCNMILGISSAKSVTAYENNATKGYKASLDSWANTVFGQTSKASYELSKTNGFTGTFEQWYKQQIGKSTYDLYCSNAVAGKIMSEKEYLAKDPYASGSADLSGAYYVYVSALNQTGEYIKPLSRDDFFKKCIENGGAYAAYTSIANEFLEQATSKMTSEQLNGAAGQVSILSESEYNEAVKGCTTTADYAKKDIELINNMMSTLFKNNLDFTWNNIDFNSNQYSAVELFESTLGLNAGYSVYKETCASSDNNKDIMNQDSWIASLTSTGKKATTETAYQSVVNNGYTGTVDEWTESLLGVEGAEANAFTNEVIGGSDGRSTLTKDGVSASNSNNGVVGASGSNVSSGVINGSNGATGATGATGSAGKNGIDGQDGRSIKAVSINDQGNLVVTFTDMTTQDAGLVKVMPQIANSNEYFIFTALGLIILSFFLSIGLVYAIHRVNRRYRDYTE